MSYHDCEEIADLKKEIVALKNERKSMLRKLKGVRAARTRDKAEADKKLHNCITTFTSIIQSLEDRKVEARADRLDFIFWYLRNTLIESKLTTTEWEA